MYIQCIMHTHLLRGPYAVAVWCSSLLCMCCRCRGYDSQIRWGMCTMRLRNRRLSAATHYCPRRLFCCPAVLLSQTFKSSNNLKPSVVERGASNVKDSPATVSECDVVFLGHSRQPLPLPCFQGSLHPRQMRKRVRWWWCWR